jgi:hypothetical protein
VAAAGGCSFVLPIVKSGLFVATLIGGGIAGFIAADGAIKIDDLGLRVDERLLSRVRR